MSVQLIATLLIAATGFGTAWQIQSWRADAKERDYVEQTLANERAASAQALRRSEAVVSAQSAAKVRDGALRRDADGARTALLGLSQSADAALRAAAASQSACLERAATFSELLVAVAAEGGELAAKAGRHASDAKTLVDAWPTNLEH